MAQQSVEIRRHVVGSERRAMCLLIRKFIFAVSDNRLMQARVNQQKHPKLNERA